MLQDEIWVTSRGRGDGSGPVAVALIGGGEHCEG